MSIYLDCKQFLGPFALLSERGTARSLVFIGQFTCHLIGQNTAFRLGNVFWKKLSLDTRYK